MFEGFKAWGPARFRVQGPTGALSTSSGKLLAFGVWGLGIRVPFSLTVAL